MARVLRCGGSLESKEVANRVQVKVSKVKSGVVVRKVKISYTGDSEFREIRQNSL